MKNLLLLVCLAFVHLCQGQSSFTYEIKGEIKGLKNDTVYLSIMSNDAKGPERILVPGNNDKFTYKGKADKPAIVWAQTKLKGSNNGNFTFFIEKGKIKMEGSNDDLATIKVTGTTGNDDYAYTQSRMNDYYGEIKPLQVQLKEQGGNTTEEGKKLYAEITSLYDSVLLFQRDFVSNHPNSLASGMMLYLITDKIPALKLEEYYLNLGEGVKQLAILEKMPTRIAGKKRSVIGSVAPDFTMNDINGNPIKLSDYRGKYVLLDFWASWCVPCRKDNPYVKATYEKFKDKDFVIIGVSVDENGVQWKKAVEKDQLPWIHISDLKKQNKVAELYGVQPIPDNFLIDPTGKIIERGLHGEQLEPTINKIINKTAE